MWEKIIWSVMCKKKIDWGQPADLSKSAGNCQRKAKIPSLRSGQTSILYLHTGMGLKVPQNAILPVGRPRPYFKIILKYVIHSLPTTALRASSQIIASPYILERHLWVNNSIKALIAQAPSWALRLQANWLYYCGDCETADPENVYWQDSFSSNIVHSANVGSM